MEAAVPEEFASWELWAGTPCWIELITPDPERACRFYAALFDWTYVTHRQAGQDDHIVAQHEGYPVASIRATAPGQSPRWRLFLATDSCAATAAQAGHRGAAITVPASRLTGVGEKSVLMSPADAEFGLLQPESNWQFDVGLPGTLMWAELVTVKALAADQFFCELFGYQSEQFGATKPKDYEVWYLGEESVLARVSMVRSQMRETTRAHWLIYLGADPEVGVDELVRRAISLEGRVRVDPYDSSLGRVAVLRDPTGARFALVDQSQAPGDEATAANFDPYDD